MTQVLDHIVIGAGISGLGAAHFSVRRGLSTLVLERAGRIGGCINSARFDALDGFWVEAGGHTCFNSYGNMLSIMDDLGLTTRVLPKAKVGYRLWQNGKRRSILSALHPVEALGAMPKLFTAPKAGRSLADYYGTVLGRRNYDDLLRYAFQAVICQPADDFPAEALFRRKPRRKEVIKAFTFAEGIATIPQAIAAQAGLEVRTGQQITAISQTATGFEIALADGERLGCRALTLAVPPNAARDLLPEGLAAARAAIADFTVAEIETLVLVFRASDLQLKPLAGLIAVGGAFYSAVSRDFLPDPRYRGFAFHFRPGSGDRDTQIRLACEALGVAPERIAASSQVRHCLPALRTGHTERVAQLDAALAGTRLAITGNWFLGVSMEDALTRSRSESDRLFGAAAGAQGHSAIGLGSQTQVP